MQVPHRPHLHKYPWGPTHAGILKLHVHKYPWYPTHAGILKFHTHKYLWCYIHADILKSHTHKYPWCPTQKGSLTMPWPSSQPISRSTNNPTRTHTRPTSHYTCLAKHALSTHTSQYKSFIQLLGLLCTMRKSPRNFPTASFLASPPCLNF